MKADQSLICTCCAILCCAFQTTCLEREIPAGYNWADIKETDWMNNSYQSGKNVTKNSWHTFGVKASTKQVGITNWRKKIMETTEPKFLISKHIRLKLLEIIPGIRNLTQKQRSAIKALGSGQIDSKSISEAKHEKITGVIGDKKNFVTSLNYEKRNENQSTEIVDLDVKSNTFLGIYKADIPTLQHTINLTPTNSGQELGISAEEKSIDPTIVNDDLMRDPNFKTQQIRTTRNKRSAARLVHKLIRVPYVNLTEGPFLKESNSSDIKLNTSSFESPYYKAELDSMSGENLTNMSYEKVEDLAFVDLNGTDIELNESDADDEHLPNAEELVAGPRYRISNKHRSSLAKGESKRKRIPIRIHHVPILQKKCERFTASMCIKADDYPIEQIMGSIRRHKNAMSALLAEYHDKAAELEYQEQLEEFELNKRRREDGNVITPGGMCASIVRYARPQKARSASGEWKYIVNTGRHTQTLRMEKCSSPQESCSYLSHNYRSRCTQVYNYHRLLSWDKTRGLHVDIFKVPTCCSCQVDGYRETFPPVGSSKLKEFQDYTPVPNNNPYSSIDDGIDYEDEDVDTDLGYQFGAVSKKNKYNGYQHSELLLGSTNIKRKVNPPMQTPTVGAYLSPPSGSYEHQLSKNLRPTYYTYRNNALSGRSQKPFQNYIPNESRADLEISGTEHTGKEVKNYSLSDSPKVHQKRTRVYAGNREMPYKIAGPQVQTEPMSKYIPTTEISTTMPSIGKVSNTDGSSARKELNNGKRINYSYHPIIDFFENQEKSAKGQMIMRSNPVKHIPRNTETIISRERRVGYEIGGPENSWHPVVVKS